MYDHYNIERVIGNKHVRDCIFNVLYNCEFVGEDKFIRVLSVMDDISLIVIEGKVENLVEEINFLRVVFLQLKCLDKLWNEETEKEDEPVDTINDQELTSHDKTKSFRNKIWFD